ncbi:hypothetical protein ACFOET_20355 [Parapedobacter deserti]|uniref:Uncharacterized protein n=1 Tax=Parapedobacter deserti TaxID=1912957 RepID=A0ABV7JPH9_9SPHI
MKKVLSILLGLTSLLFSSMITPALSQEHSPAHVGIVYPLSTHGTKAGRFTNAFSLHALWGLSGGEKGLGLYGVGGMVKGNVTGLQAAGGFNHATGGLRGAQLSGVLNQVHYADAGAQLAGVLNLSRGSIPAQLAGVLNKSGGAVVFQAAGVANVADSAKAAQLAGVINIANDVRGSQIAGLVNKAGNVSGVQLAGLLNIADSSDYPIGIINIIKNGEKRISVSTDENLSTLVSFRSGGRKLYGIIGLGANLLHPDIRYAAEAGLGIKLLQHGTFRLDMEASQLFATDFHGGEYAKNGLRILPAVQVGSRLQLFGGPSINFMDSKNPDNGDLGGLTIWESQRTDRYQSIFAGFTAGVHVVL